jgi:hypothetical protein
MTTPLKSEEPSWTAMTALMNPSSMSKRVSSDTESGTSAIVSKDAIVAECEDDGDGAPNTDFGFDDCIPPCIDISLLLLELSSSSSYCSARLLRAARSGVWSSRFLGSMITSSEGRRVHIIFENNYILNTSLCLISI